LLSSSKHSHTVVRLGCLL